MHIQALQLSENKIFGKVIDLWNKKWLNDCVTEWLSDWMIANG